MAKLKVSVVQYLNTVPLVWGMLSGEQRGKFELEFTTPARCADAIRDGSAEIGIIPCIELQRIDNLEVIPKVSISSLAHVKSVALFSKQPIENVKTIALDASSRTSVALLRILLEKYYRLSPRTITAEPDARAMLQKADAALLIGDPALVCNDSGMMVYDLAAEWKKFTGLPFVFAVWAGRASAGLRKAAEDFQKSRDYGLAHVDEIAREYAPRHCMTAEEVKIYLTEHINYNLNEAHRKGMDLFHSLACEVGLTPGVKEVRFV
ncbi:MAG TPA: menaquinone biosynthesis protein [Terriglobia bacterium]|nr:menaquinone biosynthesis protein [Terriglobia bacterium]